MSARFFYNGSTVIENLDLGGVKTLFIARDQDEAIKAIHKLNRQDHIIDQLKNSDSDSNKDRALPIA